MSIAELAAARRGLTAASVALSVCLALAAPAHSVPPAVMAKCDRVPSPPDAIIQACSAALQDSALQPPARAHLLVIRAQAEDMAGKSAEALADFSQVIELDSKQVQALNDAAKRRGPGPFQATSIADTYVGVLNGDLATAYADRGVAALRQGQLDAGIADLSNSIQVVPDYPPVLILRGKAWRLKGRLGLALADLNAALRGDPKNLAALFCRAQVYADQGDTDRAIADLSEAILLRPDYLDALVDRGAMFIDKRNYAAALADMEAAIRLHPYDVQALTDRAIIWRHEGQLEKAGADYTTVVEMYAAGHGVGRNASDTTQRFAEVVAARAGVYAELGRAADAAADADRALLIGPAVAAAWNGRCWVRGVGAVALEGALADCEHALTLDPSARMRAEILDSRALVRYRQGQFDLSMADEDAAIAADSNDPSLRYLRGLAEERLGKAAEGRVDIAAALAIDPRLADQYARWGLKPD